MKKIKKKDLSELRNEKEAKEQEALASTMFQAELLKQNAELQASYTELVQENASLTLMVASLQK